MTRGLFIMAPSLMLNPTLNRADIEAEIADDPAAARSEWLGQFREDLAQFLEDELIDRAVEPQRTALPFNVGHCYVGFADPSGGRHDAMCLGIAHPESAQPIPHVDSTRVVLDRLVIVNPPFDPERVTQEFCDTMRSFRLTKVVGDAYAGQWVSAMFQKHGIRFENSPLSKSEIYLESLPLFAQNRIELLDVPRLLTELRLLERRPRAGGRTDLVDHPPRATDDAANAALGALVCASKRKIVDTYGRPRHRYALT